MKNNVIVVVFIFVICISSCLGLVTPYSGYLYQSTPEASLGFSNLSYISPAQAYGVTGVFANPAGLGFSADYGLAFAFGTPSNPKLGCKIKILDSTDTQSELKIPFELGFKEPGGINFIGISKKLGPVGFGFGYMQKSASGLGFDFDVQGETITMNYAFKDTIMASYGSADTAIPITWNISAPIRLDGIGDAQASISKQPLFLGTGIAFGPAGIGVGLKYQKYSGLMSNGNLYFAGGAYVNAIGVPDPPFKGVIDATATIPFDTLFMATGNGEFNTSRTSLVLGTLIRTGIFKLGVTYEKGFSTPLNGNFLVTTFRIEDAPDSVITDSAYVQYIFPDSIAGMVRLRLERVPKTSDTIKYDNSITMPGYNQVDLGLSFGIFDLFLGGSIPQKEDINSAKFGAIFSIPLRVVTIRTGVIGNLDYFLTSDNKPIPLRAPVYVGVGGSVKTKFTFLPIVPDAQIDFGIKSNAIPLFSKALLDLLDKEQPEALNQITDIQTPSFLSLLSFNLGLSLRL